MKYLTCSFPCLLLHPQYLLILTILATTAWLSMTLQEISKRSQPRSGVPNIRSSLILSISIWYAGRSCINPLIIHAFTFPQFKSIMVVCKDTAQSLQFMPVYRQFLKLLEQPPHRLKVWKSTEMIAYLLWCGRVVLDEWWALINVAVISFLRSFLHHRLDSSDVHPFTRRCREQWQPPLHLLDSPTFLLKMPLSHSNTIAHAWSLTDPGTFINPEVS